MQLALDRKGPIDSYGGGMFRIGKTAHRGSLVLLPGGPRPWRIANVRQISFDALRPFFREARGSDILVFGTGAELDLPPRPVLDALYRAGFRVEAMPTPAACRTCNALLAEGRTIAAALIAVH